MKILSDIKKWTPNTTLVGFKLEATDDEQFLIDRATLRMEASDAEFMVANSSKSLYGAGEPHFIISRSGEVVKVDGKESAAKALIQILN